MSTSKGGWFCFYSLKFGDHRSEVKVKQFSEMRADIVG